MPKFDLNDMLYVEALSSEKTYQYSGYVENNKKINLLIDDEIKKNGNKVFEPESENKNYLVERGEVWLRYKGLLKAAPPRSPRQIREDRNKQLDERRKGDDFVKMSSKLSNWIRENLSIIRASENNLDVNLEPTRQTSFIQNKKSTFLKKVALLKSAKKLNSKRSFFSKVFNWAEDIRNYRAMRDLKKSIIQDNGISKKELNYLMKFVNNNDTSKYDDFDSILTASKKINKVKIEQPILVDDNLLDELNAPERIKQQSIQQQLENEINPKQSVKTKAVKQKEKSVNLSVSKDEESSLY